MKNSVWIFLVVIGVSTAAGGKTLDTRTITGTYAGMTDKFVELKTPNNLLLVPKTLLKQSNFKSNEVIELTVSKQELDTIKLKK